MLQLEYSRRRFADDVVARMLGHLQTLLEGMAAHPQARLKDLPLLTEAERQQANSRWNEAASLSQRGMPAPARSRSRLSSRLTPWPSSTKGSD